MRPRTVVTWLAALALALVLGGRLDVGSLAAGPEGAAAVQDRVVRVVDGDTVQLARTGRARLIGVDTPEVHGRRECFGPQASRFARRRLRGRAVVVRGDAEPEDRYGAAWCTSSSRAPVQRRARPRRLRNHAGHPPEHPARRPARRRGAPGARPAGRLMERVLG
jgi:hypothetical protein